MAIEHKPSQGMVAFVDILGYSNFLRNYEPDQAATTVLQLLLDMPSSLPKVVSSILKDAKSQEKAKSYLDHIKWLVFSDTILLTDAYEDSDDASAKGLRWLFFICQLCALFRHLFDNGLPIRGGVSYGRFYVREHCFAGRSIITAYELVKKLDIAAIVVDESALAEIQNNLVEQNFKIFNTLVWEYLVPLKNQTPQKMSVLSPSLPALPPFPSQDIRQTVAESFWKHKKDICPEAMSKLENTEMFFRFMKMKRPKLFSTSVDS